MKIIKKYILFFLTNKTTTACSLVNKAFDRHNLEWQFLNHLLVGFFFFFLISPSGLHVNTCSGWLYLNAQSRLLTVRPCNHEGHLFSGGFDSDLALFQKAEREKGESGRKARITVVLRRTWIRRPRVLEGAGVSTCSGGQREVFPAWATLMKLQILAFMNHPTPSLQLSSHTDSSQREGIPLRPFSSALRQSDGWTLGGRWDILN